MHFDLGHTATMASSLRHPTPLPVPGAKQTCRTLPRTPTASAAATDASPGNVHAERLNVGNTRSTRECVANAVAGRFRSAPWRRRYFPSSRKTSRARQTDVSDFLNRRAQPARGEHGRGGDRPFPDRDGYQTVFCRDRAD